MWRRTCLQRYTWNFADGSCQLWRRETLLESMLADFPTLRLEDIQAAISFAATAAAEDVPHRPQPDVSHRSRSGLSSRRIFPSRRLPLCQGSWQVFRSAQGISSVARWLLLGNFQHQLTVILPVFQQLVRLHRALEREHLSDLRSELTLTGPLR